MTLSLVALKGAAQQADTLAAMPADKAVALTTKIERELSLTKNQKALVFDLLLVRSEQGQKLVKSNPNKNDKQNLIARINNKTLEDLKKVLTQDQYTRFILLREELKKQKASVGSTTYRLSEEDLELDL